MLIVTMALTIPVASLGTASSALASPQGIYAIFSDCPVGTILALGFSPGASLCQYAQVTSGEVAIGAIKMPIDETITLQGGAIPTPKNPEVEFFVLPAADGNTLSGAELNVTGGLFGLLDCKEIKGKGTVEKIRRRTCKAIFGDRSARVTATVEPAASAGDPAIFNEWAFANEKDAAETLPIKLHLRGWPLGDSCYIGSESSPIQLQLTTGATSPLPPNQSISGFPGKPETLEENGELALRSTGVSLVDNTFSVPVAEGCGGPLSSVVDPLLDLGLKLPSADGNNTVILNGTFYVSAVEAVIASESFPPSKTPETPTGEHQPEENHHGEHHHRHAPWERGNWQIG